MDATGLRKRRGVKHSSIPTEETESKTSSAEYSKHRSEVDFRKTVQSEITAAIEESLTRNNKGAQNGDDCLKVIDEEASKMFDSVRAAEERDDQNRYHNVRMERRQRFLSVLGVFCMACPVLLVFDSMMSFFPEDHVRTLELASQQVSLFGATSRFCLRTVTVARQVRLSNNEEEGVYLWGCFLLRIDSARDSCTIFSGRGFKGFNG